jgi:hypothetical protein
MGKKKYRTGKALIIFCLVALIIQWSAMASTEEKSQKLRNFLTHVEKYHNMSLPANTYFAVLGFVFRLQWDKVMQMPESDSRKSNQNYLQELWWDLRDYAFQEGEKYKQEGSWPTGAEGMFKEFKGGFEIRGKLGDATEEELRTIGTMQQVEALSMIPSIFDEPQGAGEEEGEEEESYDDVSVEAMAGRWKINATYLNTGRPAGINHVALNKQKLTHRPGYPLYFDAEDPYYGRSDYWKLTDDGVLEWVKISDTDNTIVKLYRKRKELWEGVMDTDYSGQIRVVISKVQIKRKRSQ